MAAAPPPAGVVHALPFQATVAKQSAIQPRRRTCCCAAVRRCKVVGPTLGALLGLAAAVVAVPLGAACYLFDSFTGRKLFRLPMRTYQGTKSAIPI